MFWQNYLSDIIAALSTAAVVELYKRRKGVDLKKINWARWLKNFLLSLGIFFFSDFTPFHLGETVRVFLFPSSITKGEYLTSKAWEAFEENKDLEAINYAQEMINEDKGLANQIQEQMERGKKTQIPVGKVDAVTFSRGISNGALNDVASCYYILGKCSERIGKPCDAIQYYKSAASFTYARTWDPQWWFIRGWSPFGWFWSPAMEAENRMEELVCD